MSDMNRLRWQCRRGLLELDIVLGRFLDAHYGALDPVEKESFKALLAEQDAVLWGLISQPGPPGDVCSGRVLTLLRVC
jgi:antitoxin CptB